ncbi:MAG: LysR family transcriptional regulator [Theionarchaea archaeon]|nr:LysR family transcriptional regulator [Theionarchaea archaeon]MBU7000206.1 LysR family transcriptional regulator [Theionarchaea archaeon]MBU7020923.1 LysR family transcriptional regulator [Theionarchaea archaeon]MBU7033975.1 LysR family transcriptional regulator [Theionarchaea archaeon]MBU7040529.1 LysR family transcriptional regulator [Theionarchaea archaeon]
MRPCFKIWLESQQGKFILGEGTAQLLLAIKERGSLSDAARHLDISYAHAWRKIREIEKNTGKKIVEGKRGGKSGGSTVLTEEGDTLLRKYMQLKEIIAEACEKSE